MDRPDPPNGAVIDTAHAPSDAGPQTQQDIYEQTIAYFLGPVWPYLSGEMGEVSEVVVNGPDTVYAELGGRLRRLEGCRFPSEEALRAAALNIAEFSGRRLGIDRHSMDGRLPDGSRVHVIIPPASRVGTCISIRRFLPASFTLAGLVDRNSITPEAKHYLETIIRLRRNTVISGGTSSGKTSLLNALSAEINPSDRVIVIEDTNELRLDPSKHVVYLEAQPPRPDGRGAVSIRDLFVDSLRMRPDRIVVGEVRRGEALDLMQAMVSGHAGALATVHAEDADECLVRLEILCLMSGIEIPQSVARRLTAMAVHVIIQALRLHDGSRGVVSIDECRGLGDDGFYRRRRIFERDAGGLRWTGQRSTFRRLLPQFDLTPEGPAEAIFTDRS